jgi:hypothetical protein
MHAKFLALLVVVSQVVNRKLSAAWIFQHKLLSFGKKSFDSDKSSELEGAFDAMGSKLLKSFWGIEKSSDLFSIKAHVAMAGIVRGTFKASDFTDDKKAQELLIAVAKLADKSFNYSKLSDVITSTRTSNDTPHEKKVVSIK